MVIAVYLVIEKSLDFSYMFTETIRYAGNSSSRCKIRLMVGRGVAEFNRAIYSAYFSGSFVDIQAFAVTRV